MTLRAGVIGMGVMGKHHCRVLSELEGVEFVGVLDPQVSQDSVAFPVFSDFDKFGLLDLDYCVVAAPTSLHHKIGIDLATLGIHALIEKPVAETVEQATLLEKAFAEAGLVGAVGHIERYNPAIVEMRKRVDNGLIGEVYQIATRRQGPFPGRIADVGVVKDLATHDIHLAMWISSSTFKDFTGHMTHQAGRDYEDMLVAVGCLESGVITSHVVNWLSPFKERLTIVTGERGTLVADTLNMDLAFHANGLHTSYWDQLATFRGVSVGDTVHYAIDRYEPLKLEHECFRDAVLEGTSRQIVTLPEGLEVLKVAQACIAENPT